MARSALNRQAHIVERYHAGKALADIGEFEHGGHCGVRLGLRCQGFGVMYARHVPWRSTAFWPILLSLFSFLSKSISSLLSLCSFHSKSISFLLALKIRFSVAPNGD